MDYQTENKVSDWLAKLNLNARRGAELRAKNRTRSGWRDDMALVLLVSRAD
jgi:hypothetical protein